MRQQKKEESVPPKVEGDEGVPMSASREASDSSSSGAFGSAAVIQTALTPDPCRWCGCLCRSWCLLLTLTLLLLSLLGSWAVVQLTLGTPGGASFRVSASYDQRVPQDDTATIEPHFTTNCTVGKLHFMCESAAVNLLEKLH